MGQAPFDFIEMLQSKKKIVVAMSGGVDSSVTAALLVEQGHEVIGVSLRMWEGEQGPRVCSDHRGAEEVAKHLGISHTLLDLREQFANWWSSRLPRIICTAARPIPAWRAIATSNSARCYAGRMSRARISSPPAIMPGSHRIPRRRRTSLLRGVDGAKDQSYFLFALSQAQLSRTLFPLGGMHKTAVREKARQLDLPAAERPESQDICFGDYKALVATYAGADELGGGEVVDRSGKVLGQHGGVHTVTVGQRRGLGISACRTALRRRHRRALQARRCR